jgi:hypothetical protein
MLRHRDHLPAAVVDRPRIVLWRRQTVAFGAGLAVACIVLGPAPGFTQTTPLPPGHPQTAPLPPGHPPLGGPKAPPPVPGHPSGSEELTWTAPPGWVTETPSSSMRRAQYRIPGAAGPGECVVFYFGPGQGGDVASNVARWGDQFRRADGSPVGNALKTRHIKVHDIAVVLVEVTGTYVGGMGSGPSGPERPNYMLLGAIAEGPDARWFFRATGPRATLEAQRAAFESMIHTIRKSSGVAKR